MSDDKILAVLFHLRKHPKMIQSNYVRDNAQEVAMLASTGMITTFTGDTFGKQWLVTAAGINSLYKHFQELSLQLAMESNV